MPNAGSVHVYPADRAISVIAGNTYVYHERGLRYPPLAAPGILGYYTGQPDATLNCFEEGSRDVSFREITALLRRHFVAVAAIMLAAAAAGFRIQTRPPVYAENGSLVFTVANRLVDHVTSPRPSAVLSQSLIAVEGTMTEALSPPVTSGSLRTAAGPASYTLAPFNSYNLEYPYYELPSATLTVSAGSPVAASAAFGAVYGQVANRLAGLQARALVPRDNWITVYTAANSGPVRQTGSRLRVAAGLALLTTLTIFVVAGSLDRHRRPGSRRRAHQGRRDPLPGPAVPEGGRPRGGW
jgi:hypothetical protein